MNRICELENKYIEVLLKKGININNSKSLFISYTQENVDFVNKLVEKARQLGFDDIFLYDENPYKMHAILQSISKEEIEHHPFFNKSIWDEYTTKDANFLVLKTEIPGLMDDIDGEKIARAIHVDRITRPLFRKKQLAFTIPWCYAVLPNQKWADKLFPECESSYEKLFIAICKACMIDTSDPLKSWDEYLKNSSLSLEKLNQLEIKSLHYKNKLGTDLRVELTKNTFWSNISSFGDNFLPNIPSYENFTNPNMWKTEGIVYNSKPLAYNGKIIDKFFLKFKDGKIIYWDAKVGKDTLKGIFENEKYACYLGEAAIVEKDSPVASTNLTYFQTTLDENSGCHIGIGAGMPECVLNSENMTTDEFLELGINPTKNHIDIVIGTDDLEIEAETNKGKVLIFKNGKYNI